MKPTGATRQATGHSPLPWSVGRNDRVECANGRVVADMTFSSHSERRAPANAQLIVTAVNERERLREALRLATQINVYGDPANLVAKEAAAAALNDATPGTSAGGG